MDVTRPLAVVTPTLDGDVLRHLALTDAAYTAGQLARLLPKGSVAGVRKVLQRLAEQGIVTVSRAGSAALTFQLNREHVGADAVIALARQAHTLRARLEELLATWDLPPLYAALFGSWSRGEATTRSDVDVILVRPDSADEGAWDEQVDDMQRRVSRWTGNDARPFVVDEGELDVYASEPVLASIRREGLTVYGDPRWLRRRAHPRVVAGCAEDAR